MTRTRAWIIRACMFLCWAGAACSQDFPTRPIRIVTTQAGSGLDVPTRVIADGLTVNLRQQMIVDNRGGAGGVIAGEIVAKAPPDGYTLLSYGPAIWLLQFMRSKVPYDPLTDFSPITLAVTAPNLLVVHPSIAPNSVKELIALAKAKPGALNYGGGNTGSSAHLAAILFNHMAGTNIVHVPYKSAAQAVTALLAGEIHLMFPNAPVISPHLKSGRVKLLAVATLEPTALFPGVPTIASSGLPGYESAVIQGIFAPAKTPPALIRRLNHEFLKVLGKPDVREKFAAMGAIVVGSTPEQLTAAIKADMATLGKLIRDAGIRDQ